ncbi:MAG: hypothetical protein K2X87_31875 [Gemmataceae bacterium]|nr:hypothetical protein [Gemmataceae bacterium]
MPVYAIVFGGLLTALGAVAYFDPDLLAGGKPNQISAASPAFIGLPIALCGLLSLKSPGARKHAMHAAAVLALLGVVGGFVPVILRKFDTGQTAVQVGLGMTLLSAIFLGLCVNSFIQARKARARAANPTA